MRTYKPATFQPTVRPDWAGALSYIPEKEKSEILVALIKYPSVECNSQFWLETIKPDLDMQFSEFKRVCQEKSRGIRERWGKISITDVKTSTTYVIDSERERERKKESSSSEESNKGGVGEKEKGTTPTLEEVLEYAAQQNQMAGVGGFKCTPETAEQFWTHYESINWRMGNEARTPIANWKAKLRHWAIKDALVGPPPRETEKERKARENHEKLEELIRKSKEAQEKDKK